MQLGQRGYNVFLQGFKVPREGGGAANQHIVMACLGKGWQRQSGCLLQATANSIADDRIAQFFAGGEAHTRRRVICPVAHLHEKRRSALRTRLGGRHKITTVEHTLHQDCDALLPQSPCTRLEAMELGREPLAALGPAAGQHIAATDSCHAGAKAVAALADKLGGLISALHV